MGRLSSRLQEAIAILDREIVALERDSRIAHRHGVDLSAARMLVAQAMQGEVVRAALKDQRRKGLSHVRAEIPLESLISLIVANGETWTVDAIAKALKSYEVPAAKETVNQILWNDSSSPTGRFAYVSRGRYRLRGPPGEGVYNEPEEGSAIPPS